MNQKLSPRRSVWLTSLGLIGLLLASLATQGCSTTDTSANSGKKGKKGKGGDAGPVPVEVAKVVRKNVPIDITAVGNVEPLSTVSVRPQVSGQIEEVFIQDGQYVAKGQKLFQIDARPFEAQVAQVEATLSRDRAQLGQAQANLARDLANEKYAREVAGRYVQLFAEGVVSRDDRDRLAASADALSQLVIADKAAIESVQAQIQADTANLSQIKLQLSFTTIYSTLDGRAGNVTVKAGNIVTANQTEVLSIAQVQPIYVTFSVPENRLGEIQRFMAGTRLPVEAAGQDDLKSPERGVLTFIDNNVDSTTGTIKLKGTFQNANRKLWPGEYANVTLSLSVQSNALVIPTQAMQTGQDGTYVYVVDADHKADVRPITIGLRGESELVVDKGLSEGDMVVTQGQLRLAPGMRVSVAGEGGHASKTGS
ncbi:MAG TPA: efflux RND transporter periplasmic adaptor subunit [Bryobacteraceae bacterium]|nr:efflux RND transporter periplasmic adaptor subunit [Bryobacteraceae bacterium]